MQMVLIDLGGTEVGRGWAGLRKTESVVIVGKEACFRPKVAISRVYQSADSQSLFSRAEQEYLRFYKTLD